VTPADILDHPIEDRRTLLELAREQGVSPPSTWRWATRGCRGLKLPTVLVGHRRVTSVQAFRWWVEQQTKIANRELPTSPPSRRDETLQQRAENEANQLLGLGANQ